MRLTTTVLGLMVMSVWTGNDASAQGIAKSPAFRARDLTAPPRENWITNGGNVYNQRYSPLTELDRDTVGELKALWRTGMGSGAALLRRARRYGLLGRRNGERGKVRAFDADDGSLVWMFNTIPGPGELGHDTWPGGSTAWQFGGAPVWQTPAVDPELDLVYFSTGVGLQWLHRRVNAVPRGGNDMAVDFRGHPMFPRGFNSPTRFEADIYDCEVWGEIPSDIEGTFYRIQCDFQYRPPENEWPTGFNGDGHVSAFRFANGSVDYKGRYVKTDRLMAERKHRRRLWGVYRNHFTDDPLVANVDRGAANTHLYWHGGKMLVLKEDSLPYAIDPYSLETFGSWDFHGKWTATSMSAHPKIDPVTGEMIAYGYQAKGDLSDDIAVYTVNPAGHIVKEVWLKSPYLGIIHDIAITQKHIVIPVIARTTSLERLQSGEPMWEWDGSLPTMVGILPRDGDAGDVRWFQGPARNTLHFLNATDVGNTVQMDLPVSDEEFSPSQIKRWTFDMNSRNDRFGEEIVSRANGVLARMDDRYLSLPYRYGFVGNSDPSRPYDAERAGGNRRVTNTYVRYDLQTGRENAFFVGDTQSLQESGFVPRKGSTEEGDGYILGVASNYAEMASELHIVDAQRMEEGAVGVVKLPFRLRSGTHVNWFSAAELAEQEAEA